MQEDRSRTSDPKTGGRRRIRVIEVVSGTVLLISVASASATAGDPPSDSAPAPTSTCALKTEEASWLQEALDAWLGLTTEILHLSPEPLPWIVTFDEECVWHVASPPGLPAETTRVDSPLKLEGRRVPVRALSHEGAIDLPNGQRIPARAMAFTSVWDEGDETFFVLAMRSVWHRDVPASRTHDLDGFFLGVASHELVHTRQLVTMHRHFEDLRDDCSLPEDIGVSTIETHFADDPAFADSLEAERKLFYAAAAATDPHRRRSLATSAHEHLVERRERFFDGPVHCFGELEDLLLTLEGSATWAHYQLARLEPNVAFLPEHPEVTDRVGVLEIARDKEGGEWARNTGLPLFLLLDEYAPDWKERVMGPESPSPAELLEEGLTEYVNGSQNDEGRKIEENPSPRPVNCATARNSPSSSRIPGARQPPGSSSLSWRVFSSAGSTSVRIPCGYRSGCTTGST